MKPFNRWIALSLAACLLAEPVSAAILITHDPQSSPLSAMQYDSLSFTSQALADPQVSGHFRLLRTATLLGALVIASALPVLLQSVTDRSFSHHAPLSAWPFGAMMAIGAMASIKRSKNPSESESLALGVDPEVLPIMAKISSSRKLLDFLRMGSLTAEGLHQHSGYSLNLTMRALENRKIFEPVSDSVGMRGADRPYRATVQGMNYILFLHGLVRSTDAEQKLQISSSIAPTQNLLRVPLYRIDIVLKPSRVISFALQRADTFIGDGRSAVAKDLAAWPQSKNLKDFETLNSILKLPPKERNPDQNAWIADHWIAIRPNGQTIGYVTIPRGAVRIGSIVVRPTGLNKAKRYSDLYEILLTGALQIKRASPHSNILISQLHSETINALKAFAPGIVVGGSVQLNPKQVSGFLSKMQSEQAALKQRYQNEQALPAARRKSTSRPIHGAA